MSEKKKLIIGWREWVKLPDLEINKIKVKVDTGARTSSIHADNLKFYHRGDKEFVKFDICPEQKNNKKVISCHAQVVDYRRVKSSNGQTEKRPVISTSIELFDKKWNIEITLTNRDEMGFRMLLGRTSFQGKFIVDVSKSFVSKS